ncbi:MAG: hypothetical protein ACKVX7_03500 [Planctomycetota bacterium]
MESELTPPTCSGSLQDIALVNLPKPNSVVCLLRTLNTEQHDVQTFYRYLVPREP